NQASVECPHCHTVFVRRSAAAARTNSSRQREIDNEMDQTPLTRAASEINMEELIDMTAMVDIVFFLLIFFLVTSMSGIQSSSKLPPTSSQSDAPTSSGVASPDAPSDPHDVMISIGEDDVIRIDGTRFAEKADLYQRLKSLQSHASPDLSLMIIGHGNASHGT